MTWIVVALVALATAFSLADAAPAAAQGTAAAARPTKAEQELLDLSRAKWRWMAERKVDTLAALFHDDAVFVHMGGAWKLGSLSFTRLLQ